MERNPINTFEENHDGLLYVVTVYDDGYVQRELKSGQENSISDTEREKLETNTDVMYLTDLTEINMEV